LGLVLAEIAVLGTRLFVQSEGSIEAALVVEANLKHIGA
jgi:hypothetical protein